MSAPWHFDTETSLIGPASLAPPLVVCQFAWADEQEQIVHVRDPACRREIIRGLEYGVIDAHNLAYDACVIMAKWPDLVPLVFECYERDGAVCTQQQAKLLAIGRGVFKQQKAFGYALDKALRFIGSDFVVDKSDPYRLRWGEYLDTPLDRIPEGAIKYALDDVRAQRILCQGQERYALERGIPLEDRFRQARGALWLRLLECNGIRVDPARVEAYIVSVSETLDHDREVCLDNGLIRFEGGRWVKTPANAMERMIRLCREAEEIDLPVTESGEELIREELGLGPKEQIPLGASWKVLAKYGHGTSTKGKKRLGISLNEDACQLYGDEELEAFQRFSTASLQVKRAERLLTAAKLGLPIQASFDPCKETGRTGCSQGDPRKTIAEQAEPVMAYGSQMHNPAKDKKITRKDGSTFVRKGTRECFVPREGCGFLSTDWAGAEAAAIAQICHWIPSIGFSRMGEVINAGGNLPTEFGAMIDGIPAKEAYDMKKAGGPEWKLFNSKTRQAAKIAIYGYFANMGPAKLKLQARKQYNYEMTEAYAAELKQKLFAFAPELPLYFKWVSAQLSGPRDEKRGSVLQFKSGRLRANCWYTELANTTFQGLVADVFKDAGFRIAKEMYVKKDSPLFGFRKVNQVHDDILSEGPIPRLSEAGKLQAKIMRDVWHEWCPDVQADCEPAAMIGGWLKDAEAVWDADGNLVPWDRRESA